MLQLGNDLNGVNSEWSWRADTGEKYPKFCVAATSCSYARGLPSATRSHRRVPADRVEQGQYPPLPESPATAAAEL